ncbi:MAG: pPIWI_RE module domain-containing protein [Ruminococcus sp.]
MDAFPAADEVLKSPEIYVGKNAVPQILLPYKFGMDFTNMNIGTGVSVKEKCEFYHQLTPLLKDIAEPMGEVQSVRAIHYKKPDKKQFEVADIQKNAQRKAESLHGQG